MKLTILIAHILILTTSAFAENGVEVRWYGNYKAALKTAQDTGKPLLVSFRCVP